MTWSDVLKLTVLIGVFWFFASLFVWLTASALSEVLKTVYRYRTQSQIDVEERKIL